jgi:hypothetical protein
MSAVFSTNKTDRHDITEILLKVALNTIKQNKQTIYKSYYISEQKTNYINVHRLFVNEYIKRIKENTTLQKYSSLGTDHLTCRGEGGYGFLFRLEKKFQTTRELEY